MGVANTDPTMFVRGARRVHPQSDVKTASATTFSARVARSTITGTSRFTSSRCVLIVRVPIMSLDSFDWSQRWNGTSFQRATLFDLGLCVQLRHRAGAVCPSCVQRRLTVIHTNGIHQTSVYFCECNSKFTHRQQLLQAGWWPATPLDPQTVATFDVLRQFQYQNLQGNITAYDFYRALEIQTDGYLLTRLPVSEVFIAGWRFADDFDRTAFIPSCVWYESGDTASNSREAEEDTILRESVLLKKGSWRSLAVLVPNPERTSQRIGKRIRTTRM